MNGKLRHFAITLAAIGSVLYAWIVASAWQWQDGLAKSDELQRSAGGMIAWRQPSVVTLYGQGVASGSSARLNYNPYDPIAMLHVSDLPMLPSTQVYQLWLYDPHGVADASTLFVVSVDSESSFIVNVVAPRIFNNYRRFSITIEPSGGAERPDGQVVLSTR